MSHTGGFHPHIGSIIRTRDTIQNTLYILKDYKEAVNQMEGMFSLLKNADYNPEFRDEIEKEYEYLLAIKGLKQFAGRIKANRSKYKRWFREINTILWDKGYLENEKYQPFKLEEDEAKF